MAHAQRGPRSSVPEVDVVVVGSINHDVTVLTSRLPRPGETILGTSHFWAGGGKGANQAVASARLDARVGMIGRVGDDDAGRSLVQSLIAEGIDVSGVSTDPERPTGLAAITVDARAENTIVVSPGANAALAPEHVLPDVIGAAAVVLAQLEIPMETVVAAAASCRGTFLLNPAPARHLQPDLSERVDVLLPNRSELALLAGCEEPTSISDVTVAVGRLERRGATVVTLGALGALLVEGGDAHHVPAPDVKPVDPTGAGDAFCGALAASLAAGTGLLPAVERAVVAGAIATTTAGAQPSLPTLHEIEAFQAG